MIDFEILRDYGTTNQRLREFFTAELPASPEALDNLSEPERNRIKRDLNNRQHLEDMLNSWLMDDISFALRNHAFYTAVDLAWDSSPINKHTIPLMMYAQGRIDTTRAVTALSALPDGKDYIKKNDKGSQSVQIDLPKFFDVNVNLVRSVITRRLSAQVGRYASLYPHFNYESRDRSQVGQLRADLLSQRMDIMADQFGYQAFEEQRIRDAYLYGHTVAFPECSWTSEKQLVRKSLAQELQPAPGEVVPVDAKVVKEGINWVACHPSRLIYDKAYPLSSLNTDTGCTYCGFFDVIRYGAIVNNPGYFKRQVALSMDALQWFTDFASYFNQYFETIRMPQINVDIAINNDLKAQIGFYSGRQEDCGVVVSHLFMKVVPKQWNWGTYPYPLWTHLVIAGDRTVIAAELMPSSPAAVGSYNEHDGRLVNLSVAHELMGLQDQLTNLYTQLLEAVKRDLFTVCVLNTDIFPDTKEGREVRDTFEAIMSGKNWYLSTQILATSFAKLRDLGIDPTPDNIFKIVRSGPNLDLTKIFEAIVQTFAMAERLQVMGNAEMGQSEPREISAYQTSVMAGATGAIYSFMSTAMDRMRAAMKRICAESLIACGTDEVELPVIHRHTRPTVEAAGFTYLADGADINGSPFKVRGHKRSLIHDYIFTGRDGADRNSNSVGAKLMIELLRAMATMAQPIQEAIWSEIGKAKACEIINGIWRMADTGIDMKLEVDPGEDDSLLPGQNQQFLQALDRLMKIVQTEQEKTAAIQQQLQKLIQSSGQQDRTPQPSTNPQPSG